MQINNWFDFLLFSFVTLAVILIGLPVSIYLLKKGVEGLVKYNFSKLPRNYLIAPGLGNYSIEIIIYGLFIFVFSVWYLLFDKGGQLGNFINQTKSFFGM